MVWLRVTYEQENYYSQLAYEKFIFSRHHSAISLIQRGGDSKETHFAKKYASSILSTYTNLFREAERCISGVRVCQLWAFSSTGGLPFSLPLGAYHFYYVLLGQLKPLYRQLCHDWRWARRVLISVFNNVLLTPILRILQEAGSLLAFGMTHLIVP